MALSNEVAEGVRRALELPLAVRDGRKVPDKEDLRFLNGGGGVRLDATYAYADLANSSGLAQRVRQEVTAKIIRSYVNTAARTFRGYGGEIRSFDGDRVMAIFAGDDKNTRATRASLALNWGVHQVISPAMHRAWSDIDRYYTMQHAIGVDTGQALIVRGGVFGDSDMISVGSAPNIAAKLSEIRNRYSILVTEDVYQGMSDEVTYAAQPSWPYAQVDMWAPLGQCNIGGKVVWVRGSTYWWEPEV